MGENKIVFSSIKAKKNRSNVKLEKDEQGYYKMTLGALNIFNSAGAYYKLEGAKDLFESSSSLMRRINNGALKAELGHPKKLPGMSMNEYMNRILTIDIENIGAHIKSVELVDSGKRDNNSTDNMIYIVAWVKPHGPKAKYLEDLIEDEDANIAFSIRSLTRDQIVNGILVKTLKQIITWDIVVEPGISVATKWKTLGIESLDLISVNVEDRGVITSIKKDLEEISGLGTEDNSELIKTIEDVFSCENDGSCIISKW